MPEIALRPMVIYHGGCDDGFAGAWVAHRYFGGYVDLYPGVYQKDPPYQDVEGRHVYLIDFSYKWPVMEKLLSLCDVTIIDHHDTAVKELAPLNLKGVLKNGESGSMLAWKFFFGQKKPPELLAYIEDRDLWLKQLPGCDEVVMALRSYPQEIETWNDLMSSPASRLLEEGKHIHRYYRTLVDEAKKRARVIDFYGHAVPVVNVSHYLASEVAGELCGREYPFAAAYWDSGDRRTYSLRSRGDFHVGDFAAEQGGGGHKNAAGFSVSLL